MGQQSTGNSLSLEEVHNSELLGLLEMERFLLKYCLRLCRAKRHSKKDDLMPWILSFCGRPDWSWGAWQGWVNYQLRIVYAFYSPLSRGKYAHGRLTE